MNTGFKLGQELAHHEYLHQQLKEKFPDADEETLCDTLEGMTDLNDMLAELIRSALEDKVLTEALNSRMADMRERADRFKVRAQKKRDLVCAAMSRAELKKITEADFTLSLRAGKPGMNITDETIIPAKFWIAQEPKLDRIKLRQALVAGEPEVFGADLTNAAPTISVRTK